MKTPVATVVTARRECPAISATRRGVKRTSFPKDGDFPSLFFLSRSVHNPERENLGKDIDANNTLQEEPKEEDGQQPLSSPETEVPQPPATNTSPPSSETVNMVNNEPETPPQVPTPQEITLPPPPQETAPPPPPPPPPQTTPPTVADTEKKLKKSDDVPPSTNTEGDSTQRPDTEKPRQLQASVQNNAMAAELRSSKMFQTLRDPSQEDSDDEEDPFFATGYVPPPTATKPNVPPKKPRRTGNPQPVPDLEAIKDGRIKKNLKDFRTIFGKSFVQDPLHQESGLDNPFLVTSKKQANIWKKKKVDNTFKPLDKPNIENNMNEINKIIEEQRGKRKKKGDIDDYFIDMEPKIIRDVVFLEGLLASINADQAKAN